MTSQDATLLSGSNGGPEKRGEVIRGRVLSSFGRMARVFYSHRRWLLFLENTSMSHEMVVSLAFLAILAVAASHAALSRKRGLSMASTTSQGFSPAAAPLWELAPPSRCADQHPDSARRLLETAPL